MSIAHMILVQQYRILHRDVSVNNMMVVPYQGGARNSRAPSNDAPDSEDRPLEQMPSRNSPAPADKGQALSRNLPSPAAEGQMPSRNLPAFADEGQAPSQNLPAPADEGQALSRNSLAAAPRQSR